MFQFRKVQLIPIREDVPAFSFSVSIPQGPINTKIQDYGQHQGKQFQFRKVQLIQKGIYEITNH